MGVQSSKGSPEGSPGGHGKPQAFYRGCFKDNINFPMEMPVVTFMLYGRTLSEESVTRALLEASDSLSSPCPAPPLALNFVGAQLQGMAATQP